MRQSLERRVVEEAKSLAKKMLGDDFSHGYPHVERVHRIAWRIVENIGLDIDWFILDTAIYLHDLGRVVGEPHAYYSALIARGFLEQYGVERDRVELIVNAILYHSYSYSLKHCVKPLSIEAKVLSDADKLDALGIIGFLRVFHYSWRTGRSIWDSIRHFQEKIYRLPSLMHFDYTRTLGERLAEKTKHIVEELVRELET